MAKDNMGDLAEKLVDEFLTTNRKPLEWSWNLKIGQQDTGEEVTVVVAIRQRKPKSTKAALGGSGTPCPMCEGSGRI